MINFFILMSVCVQVPQLFVDGRYVGGHEQIMRMHGNGRLKALLQKADALE